MKTQNKFDLLSTEDQHFILDLCSKHPYTTVVDLLEQPRPVGLDLITSTSSLCRWFTKRRPEAVSTQALGQISKAIQVRHQSDASGHTEAILTLVQNRILEALLNGKAIIDLKSEFRVMLNLQRAHIAEARWNASPQARNEYKEYAKRICNLPEELDYISTSDHPSDFTLEEHSGLGIEDDPEEIALDLARQKLEDEALLGRPMEAQHLQLLRSAQSAATADPAQPENATNDGHASFNGPECSAFEPHHPPVIPHIPPNSTTPAPIPDPISQILHNKFFPASQFAEPLPRYSTSFHDKMPAIPHIPPDFTTLPRVTNSTPSNTKQTGRTHSEHATTSL